MQDSTTTYGCGRLEAGSPMVLILGAGVSGCACAAALAQAGLRVTLVNSAMDRVALPAYGPDLIGEDTNRGRLEDVIGALPHPIGAIWLGAATSPKVAGGAAVMNVDRRRISVETKRLLELVPGVEFRQGFVVDLRVVRDEGERGIVQAETIFGEVLEADAAVVAVGLSLDGRTSVGGETIEGGRYGEPASDDLCRALEALGAEFRDAELEVGCRASARDFGALELAPLATSALATSECATGDNPASASERQSVSGRRVELKDARADADPSWPEGYPPAPHLNNELRSKTMLMEPWAQREGRDEDIFTWRPAVSPDGAATAEVYVAPEGIVAQALNAQVAEDSVAALTRMTLRVTAKAVVNREENGRLLQDNAERSGTGVLAAAPVWVIGRAAGARDYIDSLASGVRAARNIAALLTGGDDA